MMVGIVTGLRSEAACIPPSVDRMVVSTGADAERARQAVERLIRQGVTALVSFGLAGGLDPEARPGDLPLPETVVLPGGTQAPADPAWRARVEERLRGIGSAVLRGPITGSDRLLASVEDKRRLREATGAIAVDMESHAVALAAEREGLPFLVLRAIADPADQALPEAARRALGADGRIRVLEVLRALLDRPQDLGRLIRLWRQSARAHASLRSAALLAGSTLDLG